MMTNSESKFRNTSIKMNKALLELLEVKSFSEISIIELCKKANVNRSTFYSHYENTYELLEETISNTLEDFFNQFNNIFIDRPFDEWIFINDKFLVPYLKYIKNNSRIFKLYMSNLNLFKADSIFNTFIHNLFFPIFKSYGITNKKTITYMSLFYLQGITAIVSKWLDNNCEDEISYVSDVIVQCVKPYLKSR